MQADSAKFYEAALAFIDMFTDYHDFQNGTGCDKTHGRAIRTAAVPLLRASVALQRVDDLDDMYSPGLIGTIGSIIATARKVKNHVGVSEAHTIVGIYEGCRRGKCKPEGIESTTVVRECRQLEELTAQLHHKIDVYETEHQRTAVQKYQPPVEVRTAA